MIILGTNSIKDTGYDVANSCRFNDGDSPRMHKTPSGAGNRRKFTISAWVKRGSNLGANSYIFDARVDGSDNAPFQFNTSDQIFFRTKVGGSSYYIQTNRVFRDVSAFYHLAIVYDNTLGTAGDRIQLWVNGVRETSFAGSAMPPQNTDTTVNNASVVQTVGSEGGGASFFDGYISEFVLLDGTANSPVDTLGSFDEDSGIWKPINVSGLTFGTNGFYLDFEDSANLGNDANGGTDLTEVNLAATDQSTDTCTNNFATLNPLHSIGASSELSQGNLEYDPSGHHRIISTIAPSSGKWYAEVKGIDNPDKFNAGVCYYPIPANGSASSFAFGQGVNADVGRWSNDFGIKANGDYGHNNSWSSYMASLEGENNNIVGIYMDLDNYKLYFSKNGSLVSSTGKDLTNNGYPYGFISVGEAGTFQWNFGNPSFAISSGNTDGEYGNFEYSTTITGDGASKTFKALCTKNLAEYG